MPEEAPSGPASFACPDCGKECASQFGLYAHRRWCKGTPPAPPKTGPKAEGSPAKPKAEKPPTVPAPSRKKRVPCAHLLGPLWGQLARLVPDVPAQRAMVWQAPAAGESLDKALAGSLIDRWVLQKVASTESRYRSAYDLVSLPVLVAIVNRQPHLFPMLRPVLRESIKANLDAALDAKAQEKIDDDRLRRKAEAAGLEWETEQVDPETGQKVKVDLIDHQLQVFFAAFGEEEVPETEPEKVAA